MKAPVCLPAEARPVPGWPGLSVTATGQVYGPRGLRKPSTDSEGYRYVSARIPGRRWPQTLRIHVAVLLAWIGPAPEGQEGRHLNGDQGDNTLGNLRWSTHLENIADKYAHGTMARGEQSCRAKLTEADVRAMRSLWPGLTQRVLADRYGVSKSNVGMVVRRETWGHL